MTLFKVTLKAGWLWTAIAIPATHDALFPLSCCSCSFPLHPHKIGACSEWIFFKLADIFVTKHRPWWKNCNVSHLWVIWFNNVYVTYCFMNGGNHIFKFQRGFRWFLLNYTDFALKISRIKPSKYDSTFGTKVCVCLKKVGRWGCGSEQAPLTFG